jgi:ubiE/COQ5 methyltransferase family
MTRPVSPVRTAWRYSAAPLGRFGGSQLVEELTVQRLASADFQRCCVVGRARHPIFARFFARVSPSMERAGTADCRHALLAGLTGRVIDVGVSLVLCSVVDLPTALHELHRVIKPGGELRFFEHVRADTPGLRRVQRLVDATIRPALFGDCHTGRDTAAAIEDAGFTIRICHRFRLPDVAISPAR